MSHPISAQAKTVKSAADAQRQFLQFASDAAHELVGPVDQTSSLVALFVRRYRGRLDAEADALLAHIESAGARMARTAKGLRAYFRVASSEREKSTVDMNAALHSALFLLDREVRESNAEISAEALPSIEGDPNLFILLFQVLLENALKFQREGAPPRVTVSSLTNEASYVFSISDNGIGVDPAHRDTVFTAFKKLNGHSYPGAGMGLTMARAIVEMHDGRIWVDHHPDAEAGLTVCFELPK